MLGMRMQGLRLTKVMMLGLLLMEAPQLHTPTQAH